MAMQLGTAAEALHHRFEHETGNTISDFIGSFDQHDVGPRCFLVELPPHHTIRAHFHRVDQFQVVVAGFGTLGRRSVAPWTVHYADNSSTYGPIVAGEEGLAYLTLRPVHAWGPTAPHYMPESKGDLTLRPGRHSVTTLAPAATSDHRGEVLLEGGDGLAVTELAAPAGVALGDPDIAHNLGSFVLVLEGNIDICGRRCDSISVLWLDPDSEWPILIAGPEGARAIHLSYGDTSPLDRKRQVRSSSVGPAES